MAKILVVDDVPDWCKMLSHLLKLAGHSAMFVTDGDDALALLRRARFDLVVLDLFLPGFTGFDVLRSIRGKFNPPIPVLVYSAHDEDAYRATSLALGAQAYVVKTGKSVEAFVETVQRLLPAVDQRDPHLL